MKLLENRYYIKMYEKMKEIYTFGFCPADEIDDLISFLNKNWKENYSLCVSRALMDWQFLDECRGVYNFLLAKHKATGDIHSIMGIIPSYGELKQNEPIHFYLSILQTLKDCSPSLNIFLYCYMEENFDIKSCTSNSFGPQGEQVFRKIGFNGGLMNHYYLVNRKVEDFKILGNFNGIFFSGAQQNGSRRLETVNADSFIDFLGRVDLNKYLIGKSERFYIHRYIEHPIYKYEYLFVLENEEVKGAFVYRCLFQESRCIKLIDFIGDEYSLAGLSESWQTLLETNCAEYVDIYNIGLEEKVMNDSGFIKRNGNDGIIVPHYFEPFVMQNIELVYGTNTDSNKKLMLFRGDGDQDRPQIIGR